MARRHIIVGVLLLGAGVLAGSSPKVAHADGPGGEKAERCAIRLSAAILGASPSAALMTTPDPQSQVDDLLGGATKGLFLERFARFVNSEFNVAPGTEAIQDAAYYTAYRVLDEGRRWEELFTGKFRVSHVVDANQRIQGYQLVPSTDTSPTADGTVNCQHGCNAAYDDPDGLGYFRSPSWMNRYKGNEGEGTKLVTANRIMQNVIGLKLAAVTNVPDGADISATGREAPACRTCHYDSPYALDKIASVLSVRNTKGNDPPFLPPRAASVTVLGGKTITDDASLVKALVESDAFVFRSCRLAFQYLYGRAENTCEAPLFDRCVDAFRASGKMQDALATIAKDPSFCE